MTADYRCPTCGDTIPQAGGPVDEDIRQAHHWGEHNRAVPKSKPDSTYSSVLIIAAAAVVIMLLIVGLA